MPGRHIKPRWLWCDNHFERRMGAVFEGGCASAGQEPDPSEQLGYSLEFINFTPMNNGNKSTGIRNERRSTEDVFYRRGQLKIKGLWSSTAEQATAAEAASRRHRSVFKCRFCCASFFSSLALAGVVVASLTGSPPPPASPSSGNLLLDPTSLSG